MILDRAAWLGVEQRQAAAGDPVAIYLRDNGFLADGKPETAASEVRQ
jgi:hypothetical protein